MPANSKYLTTSPWQRFGKITAGIAGGYLVTMCLHLALASWIHHVNVIITMAFSGFILWAALMILAFLSKSAWKIWLFYLLLSLIFLGIGYLGKLHNPEFMSYG